VFLKSLSMKGFKSFADPTVLEFEPGITVVVGPNGSGKSNVVDAVTWVLGAQGPRSLRSAKMEDVIFAGTSSRAALGRAEVSLTIDNASGKLPIDLAEVTITRTLFRSGDSEYAINGAPCRLLDVQELLSDSGVGRQQHMIIGQGQLDTVLNARPEDRRAIIEEAAGVLKTAAAASGPSAGWPARPRTWSAWATWYARCGARSVPWSAKPPPPAPTTPWPPSC
jgi:chromosome segregation protein